MTMLRNKWGQFTKWKGLEMTPFRKRMGYVIGAIVLTVMGGSLKEALGPTVITATNKAYADEVTVVKGQPDRLQSKVRELKDEVLNTLEKCESGGKEVTIVFDSNARASVGNYQWQTHSFAFYWEKKTGEKITEKQAAIKALDNQTARELAEWVIFETEKGGSRDWFNCFKWHSLQSKVDVIKELEK